VMQLKALTSLVQLKKLVHLSHDSLCIVLIVFACSIGSSSLR